MSPLEAPLRVLAICAVVIELLNPIQTCVRMHDVLNGKATAFLFWHIFWDVCHTSHTNTCENAEGIRGHRNKYVQALQATRPHKDTHTHTVRVAADTRYNPPHPHSSRQPRPAVIRRLQTHPGSALSNRWYILTITANKSLLPPVPCPFT